jgi:hypothetical protein
MTTKGPDTFKIRLGFKRWDVYPKEGCNFIMSDGHIHFESCTGGAACTEVSQRELQESHPSGVIR